MSNESEIAITWDRVGNAGVGVLTIVHVDGVYVDKFDITKKKARTLFLEELHESLPGLPLVDIQAQLEELAGKAVPRDEESVDGDSQADLLVALTEGDNVELFHTAGGHDADAYATIECDGHRETWAVQSRGFKRWLLSQFLRQHKKAPNEQALRTAIGTIEAKAVFDGVERDVFVRVAGAEGVVWLDLGDPTWRAIRIDRDGYAVVDSESVDVRFRRPAGMLRLPAPEEGGSLEQLRELVNVSSDDDWVLLEGWLVMALHPKGDHPILAVNGEEASAKSTLCRLLRKVIDPNQADLRRPPREELDLVIAANNAWVVGFDNFSGLTERLSDALCCLSTGSAFSTRTLFTTKEETLIVVKRPVILNGIPDLATRGDLASRCISLTLEAIPPTKRRTRKEVERALDQALPRILGALLRAVSCALRRQDEVKLPGMTRMADMCVWVTAAEPALGHEPGTFVAAYERRISESVDTVIESSPIGSALLELLDSLSGPWVGTPTDLRAALEEHRGEGRRPRGWPDSAQKTSNEVRRIAPSLRKKGIPVVEPKKGSNPRLFRIGPLPADDSGKTEKDARCGEARASAGDTPPEGPEKADSRASALPALSSETSEDGDDEGPEAQDREFGWVD